ncbi:hypothetical protein C8A05DRAFT_11364 [Staphylotrichum tortipilum]|uniref:rRNA-processing protein FYV7 n=1 Tax=Staphylotrichum tortipilum TaxID=2831512 RepID=A0AAN6RYJ2_9PEZI|nr:hypothetical protein C8A05DRAFT_11364 [Staphylotrichum longicolle]
MSTKRPRDEAEGGGHNSGGSPDDDRRQKKAKHGFRVGPENLPDGAWRRKVTKIKKDLITKAKVKKQYAKIKAEHQKHVTAPPSTEGPEAADSHHDDEPQAAPVAIHPERQAMLDSSSIRPKPNNTTTTDGPDADHDAATGPTSPQHERRQRRPRKQRPDYYNKQLATAEETKKKADERAAEFARRQKEREKAIADRERYRKAMAKAKEPGRDGKRKVGREGKLLLDRVKKMMGET